jgi:DNA-directed RNA polymerase subunit RPC12/RpoP
MPEKIIESKGWRCERCGHEWIPKKFNSKKKPITCPKCRSPYWDTPKK